MKETKKVLSTAEKLAEDTFVLLGIKKPKNKGKSSFKTWLYTKLKTVSDCIKYSIIVNYPLSKANGLPASQTS